MELGPTLGQDPDNEAIADQLMLHAALLEIADAGAFSVRAYRRAADVIREAPAPVAPLVRSGEVRRLRGIGPRIEQHLREIVETGRIAAVEELERELSPDVVALGRLLGLTAPRVLLASRTLGVRSAEELRAAIEEGRLTSVRGIGPVTDRTIRERLAEGVTRPRHGLLLHRARELTAQVARAVGGVAAGDPRRFREVCFDLAVVCTSSPDTAHAEFASVPQIVAIVERRERQLVGLTVEGVPITLVSADAEAFGTELVRATGAPGFVQQLEPLPSAPDEHDVFAQLGMTWVPPERRELTAVLDGRVLVERTDLRGDLHMHTTWSDGAATVEEMARAAIALGHDYVAICDHTPAVGVVHGLTAEELRRQADEIAEVNERLHPFRVLRGVECDIRPDGSLDAADDVLRELDWVQVSLHAGQRRPGSELTPMVCEALRHPAVRSLSHPKGRIIQRRPENELDLDAVFEVARAAGVAMEINGLPDRLDLSSEHAGRALAAGVRLTLSSDAHSTRGLAYVALAVGVARRAGATAADVVNCGDVDGLLESRPDS